jgi:hypothetical protein
MTLRIYRRRSESTEVAPSVDSHKDDKKLKLTLDSSTKSSEARR